MSFLDRRKEAENKRHKPAPLSFETKLARGVSALKGPQDICLITYFTLHGLDLTPVDGLLEAALRQSSGQAGLSDEQIADQIQDVWETPVKDIELLMWICLTNGRVKPC